METEQGFDSFDPKMIPVLIVYAIVMTISIIIVRALIKKYKKIPDKTVIAKLYKTSDYFGDGGPSNNFDPRVSYTLAKYEYYINGKRHKIKFQYRSRIPDTRTLYYKIGYWDIRTEKRVTLPTGVNILLLSYFVVGVALITVIIAQFWGFYVN